MQGREQPQAVFVEWLTLSAQTTHAQLPGYLSDRLVRSRTEMPYWTLFHPLRTTAPSGLTAVHQEPSRPGMAYPW